MIDRICAAMWADGWAVDGANVVFGMGGGLLQQMDRDTHKFAIKCSAACIDGEWIDVYKKPKTDKGKNSKRGKLKLITDGKEYSTVREGHPSPSILQTVFNDGYITKDTTWDEVKAQLLRGSSV